jgi:hypothetical protein
VAPRHKVVDTISAHLGTIPGAKVKIEKSTSIADARKKQANVLKRGGSKYN